MTSVASIRRIAYDTGNPPPQKQIRMTLPNMQGVGTFPLPKPANMFFGKVRSTYTPHPNSPKTNLDHMAASSVNGVLRPSEATNYADKQLMGLSY